MQFLRFGTAVQQTVVHRIAGHGRRIAQTQFMHHFESMFFDRLDAASEIPGNPLARITERNSDQHLALARSHLRKRRLGRFLGGTPPIRSGGYRQKVKIGALRPNCAQQA